MTAEIIDLSLVRLHRNEQSAGNCETPRRFVSSPDCAARFHFWTGASGKRYVHTIYSLFDCPPLDAANYVLVRREGKAARSILAIGRLTNETATLNLAEIRQRAALLGADEVHIHLLATSVHESHAVETDLRSAQVAMMSN